MKTEPNEPAHPSVVGKDGIYPQVGSESWQLPGLTKREYIVARAMQGFISSCDWKFEAANLDHAKETARLAVIYADALIVELNK